MPRRLTKADIGKIYHVQDWLESGSKYEYARLIAVGMLPNKEGVGKSLMQTFRVLGDGRILHFRWTNTQEVSPESLIANNKRDIELHTREAERHTRLRDEAIARSDIAIANANNLKELIALDDAREMGTKQ